MKSASFFYKMVLSFAVVAFGLCVSLPAHAKETTEIIWYTDNAPVQEQPITDSATDPACQVGQSALIQSWLATKGAGQTHAPRIVIVIDDMGVDRKRSARVMALPGPLTLSFLPYAHDVQHQVRQAAVAGHEIMMHVPMQPEDTSADPGPNVLATNLAPEELKRRIAVNLDAFAGYVGINNHMGSAFTRDRAALDILMAELSRRGLFFLDSKTHPLSIAEQAAMVDGVSTAGRDVFLDHVETAAFVDQSLHKLEKAARRQGAAIAIGHPKDVTIAALTAWIPQAKSEGFDIVTLSSLLKEKKGSLQVTPLR